MSSSQSHSLTALHQAWYSAERASARCQNTLQRLLSAVEYTTTTLPTGTQAYYYSRIAGHYSRLRSMAYPVRVLQLHPGGSTPTAGQLAEALDIMLSAATTSSTVRSEINTILDDLESLLYRDGASSRYARASISTANTTHANTSYNQATYPPPAASSQNLQAHAPPTSLTPNPTSRTPSTALPAPPAQDSLLFAHLGGGAENPGFNENSSRWVGPYDGWC